MRAMALEILTEWRLASAAPELVDWLARGAPSEDAGASGTDRDRLPAPYRR